MSSNKIWVSGVGFEVDARCYRWDEGPGFDAHPNRCVNPGRPCGGGGVHAYGTKSPTTRANRWARRPQLRKYGTGLPPLAAVQGVVRQFVLHHDGLGSSKQCFEVLQNERALSCHFLIDNDGTIYQTLDLAYMGFHAGGFNARSVGVELCNRGDAKRFPSFYSRTDPKRNVATCKIHGHVYLAFDYTPEQYRAMRSLTKALARALPNMPIDYPQLSPGYQAWEVIPDAKSYAGLLGHYHTVRKKWDPGPFDFKVFCESLRGQLSFPVSIDLASAEGGRKGMEVPSDDTQRSAAVDKLHKRNEMTDGGFFPVGPYGEHRVWHGGLHVPGKLKEPIYAPFPGRLMAVRTGAPLSAVGETNFVLLRHDLRVGQEAVRFYTLLFHLADEASTDPEAKGAPLWLKSKGWQTAKTRGQVVLLDEPVEAGDIVGRMGMAGPVDTRRPQVHVEMFAMEDIAPKIGLKGFKLIDGTASGRFAPADVISPTVDADKNGQLSRRELVTFFSSPETRLARRLVTLHVSEWTAEPSWREELARSPEFRDLGKRDLEDLVSQQVDPTLWWTDQVAKHARLQPDGVVFHYNPIALIGAINDRLQEYKTLAANGKNAFAKEDAKEKPPDVHGDEEDEAIEHMLDESELKEVDYGRDLTLEDLANGFPD
jgi:N-acetyl-anhydromuramyl-L-alanine amidase AmpD